MVDTSSSGAQAAVGAMPSSLPWPELASSHTEHVEHVPGAHTPHTPLPGPAAPPPTALAAQLAEAHGRVAVLQASLYSARQRRDQLEAVIAHQAAALRDYTQRLAASEARRARAEAELAAVQAALARADAAPAGADEHVGSKRARTSSAADMGDALALLAAVAVAETPEHGTPASSRAAVGATSAAEAAASPTMPTVPASAGAHSPRASSASSTTGMRTPPRATRQAGAGLGTGHTPSPPMPPTTPSTPPSSRTCVPLVTPLRTALAPRTSLSSGSLRACVPFLGGGGGALGGSPDGSLGLAAAPHPPHPVIPPLAPLAITASASASRIVVPLKLVVSSSS